MVCLGKPVLRIPVLIKTVDGHRQYVQFDNCHKDPFRNIGTCHFDGRLYQLCYRLSVAT